MIEKLIKVRVTRYPKRVILLTDSRGELHTTIEDMQTCGWFVTNKKKETMQISMMHTLDYDEFTLRNDQVVDGCVLVSTKSYRCNLCRQKHY